MDPTTPGANFFHKRNAQEKFQLKIPTLSKIIVAPPGVQIVTGKKVLAAISGMVIGMKNK